MTFEHQSTFSWSQTEHPAAGRGSVCEVHCPWPCWCSESLSTGTPNADRTQKFPNLYPGQAGVVPSEIHELGDPLHGQSCALVCRPSLAQGVTGGGQGRDGSCSINESSSRVHESKIHPSGGVGIRILVVLGHDLFRL